MIRKSYPWVLLLAGVGTGLFLSGRIRLHAQDRSATGATDSPRATRDERIDEAIRPSRRQPQDEAAVSRPASGLPGTGSIQDLLLRPYHFPFAQPTSLTQLCTHLKRTLNVPIVLDLAALGRQDVDPDDTVQLELDGVRLKTGLKLLLDQVGLTYQVVAEDNLLIITDREGSDDPLDRVWAELRTLHRDLHEVQDAIEGLSDSMYADKEEGPRMRKPTIIEEMPDQLPPAQGDPPVGRDKPAKPEKKPGGAQMPGSSTRPTPSRVPL